MGPPKLCIVRTKETVNISHGYQKAPQNVLKVDVGTEGQGLLWCQQVKQHLLQAGEPDAEGVELAEGLDRVVLQPDHLLEEEGHLKKVREPLVSRMKYEMLPKGGWGCIAQIQHPCFSPSSPGLILNIPKHLFQ